MSEMKTLKFPGDTEPREIVDAKAREDISKLSEEMLTEGKLSNAVNVALTQAKESGEFDGAPGKDGQDGADGQPGANGTDGYSPTAYVTQTETGAVITITDKNGTTTATVKNGADGKQGPAGAPGADGATPQRGVDYWTEEDIATIKSYVDDAILGGAW